MKTVICTNPKNYNLTLNREYQTQQEDDNSSLYSIINDRGLTRNYSSELFTDLEVEQEPTVRELTDQEIVESIQIIFEDQDFDCLHFKLSTTEHSENGRNNIVSNEIQIFIENSQISCGVLEIYNINNIISEINRRRSISDNQYVKIEILKKIIQEVVENHEGLFFILFTTENSIGELKPALDEMSEYSDTGVNPNSNNEIVFWTIKK